MVCRRQTPCSFVIGLTLLILAACSWRTGSAAPHPGSPTPPEGKGLDPKVAGALTVAQADVAGKGELRELTLRLKETMARIKQAMQTLREPKMNPSAYLDQIVRPELRREGFENVTRVLQTRVEVEQKMLSDVEEASRLYDKLHALASQHSEDLKKMTGEMEREIQQADLLKQGDKFVSAFLGKEDAAKAEFFQDTNREAVELIRMAKAKLQQAVPVPAGPKRQFAQLLTAVRTRLTADRYQFTLTVYVVRSLQKVKEVADIAKLADTIHEIGVVDYVSELVEGEVDVENLGAALKHTYAKLLASMPAKPGVQPAGVPVEPRGFAVSIVPNKGRGAMYTYGEKIFFTITANADCDFILLSRDSKGTVQQLCPNEWYRGENHLRANQPLVIPNETLAYEFVGSEPPGIDTLKLICMDKYRYDVKYDWLEVKPVQMRGGVRGFMNTRGIKKQLRPGLSLETGGLQNFSYDHYYHPNKTLPPGSYVTIETFTRTKPR